MVEDPGGGGPLIVQAPLLIFAWAGEKHIWPPMNANERG
jgi:hypothetical protein